MNNSNITGKNAVSVLVGNASGRIDNCHSSSGYVKAIEGNVGGIVGKGAQIVGCSSSDMRINGLLYVGGLSGSNSVIVNSYSSNIVSGDICVGGLIGISGNVENSFSNGKVYGNERVGGLVGQNMGNILNCYATGDVIGQIKVGGLVGVNYRFVENCYATGLILGGNYHVGGLIGVSLADYGYYKVTDSFFDINTTNKDDGHYRGRTTSEMMNPETFKSWDFQNVWWMIPGKTYPLLRPVRYVGLNIKPEQTAGLPAEYKIIFDEPVRNFTFDDVDLSLSTIGGIQGTLTPDDAPTTITTMDCFSTWTLRLEDAASTTGLIVMRLPVAAAINAANYPTTESTTLILPIIESLFGDLNADGVINTLDRDILIALILDPESLWHSRLLLPSAADINKDGVINVADIISLITCLK